MEIPRDGKGTDEQSPSYECAGKSNLQNHPFVWVLAVGSDALAFAIRFSVSSNMASFSLDNRFLQVNR
jgi:hypothetical protein